MANTWCTIESDPGVFTELIEGLGVRGVQVEELFSLDDDSFASIQPAFGLMFLFKWTEETTNKRAQSASVGPVHPELFYAKQVITNACGTQALLSILLNSVGEVEVGRDLELFRDFTQSFDADMKGYTLGESEFIREQHNAFARPEPFQMDGSGDGAGPRRQRRNGDEDEDEAYHFIAYVPFQGGLYELDGLNRSGAVLLEENVDAASWLQCVRPHIEARIARYEAGEIHFNLMALIRDRRLGAEPGSIQLEMEEEKRKQWKEENARRKHNYVPFIVSALRLLAERNELSELVRQAKERELGKRA